MRKVELSDYEFSCLVGKLGKDLGGWSEQNLFWDRDAAQRIRDLAKRLMEISEQYLETRE